LLPYQHFEQQRASSSNQGRLHVESMCQLYRRRIFLKEVKGQGVLHFEGAIL